MISIECEFDEEIDQRHVMSLLDVNSLISSMSTEIQQKTIKLLSLIINDSIIDLFIPLIPDILEFMTSSPEDEFLEYSLEMLNNLCSKSNNIPELLRCCESVFKVVVQVGNVMSLLGILDQVLNNTVIMEQDLLRHLFFYLNFNLSYKGLGLN